ncbi:MAG: hypothetical protein QM777_25605 [Pseudorhodoferax sp.]
MTLARLREVSRRQDPPRWGAEYEPGIKATRAEAPAISRAAAMWCERLRRDVHALSKPEQTAVLLALHHPRVFEMQEQRMLPVAKRPHPLTGHPRAVGLDLPAMEGTIAVADRLDLLKVHGWLRARDAATGEDQVVPIPFMGDLLLFLSDDRGPFCINWTIKASEEDFSRSISLRKRVRNETKDASAAIARHAIEEQLYLDAGIRTVRVVARTIPPLLESNLRNLFLHQRCVHALDADVERELEDRVRAGMQAGRPPQEAILGVTHRRGCAYQDVRHAFFRILWERRVRAELVEATVLVDQPLVPERNDLFGRFGHLFDREV